ncbi:MAG: hypothetical protein JWO19_4692 [Bryobacterales bacterium]|nr:hypothetical protein [Bryobacterales bacterium]
MLNRLSLPLATLFLVLCSCATKDAERPHATVTMRDGSTFAGNVTSSSASEITLAGDDKSSRTIPMNQVRSIEYDDAPATAAAEPAQPATTPATATTPAPATASTNTKRQVVRSQAAHQDHYHPPQSVVNTKTYLLPVGTEISVRAEETIDSSKGSEGQTYAAEVTQDVLDADGAVVIPAGSNAKVVIKSVSKGGRFAGQSDLVLDLRAVSVEGQEYLIGTSDIQKSGRNGVGANKRTAVFTGGGAAIGAIIGAIAGGGKGAAIGAASGAGAGALTQVLTKGSAIRVPAETILTFKLDRPLRVDATR